RQTRLASTATRTERTDAGRRNRGVHTVGERSGPGDHTEHRQAHLERDIAAGEQDGAATGRLDEATATTVVGAGEATIADALGLHVLRLGGRGHVTEADDALDTEIVEATGDDQIGLAELDLVHALLDGDRSRGARRDRVHHRAVATDVRLDDVCGDDVRQGL